MSNNTNALNMRATIYLLILFGCLPVRVFGQPIEEDVNYAFEYTFKYKRDSMQTGYATDLFKLDVCSSFSKYYSHISYSKDSVAREMMAQDKTPAEIRERTNYFGRGSHLTVVKKNGILIVSDKFINETLVYEEPFPAFNWQIASQTDTVCGYLCHLATCDFRGRHWQVWFTPEIPIMEGPWKFAGLPGLIIKACDSKRDFIFELVYVSESQHRIISSAPSKDPFQKTTRVQFMAVDRKSKQDPTAFLESQGFRIGPAKKSDGTPFTMKGISLPYNPMELY